MVVVYMTHDGIGAVHVGGGTIYVFVCFEGL